MKQQLWFYLNLFYKNGQRLNAMKFRTLAGLYSFVDSHKKTNQFQFTITRGNYASEIEVQNR